MPIGVRKAGARAYRAWCSVLPGCCVEGTTRKDATHNLKWAIKGYRACLDATVPKDLQEHVLVVARLLAHTDPCPVLDPL
jgi:hypothetical protein